MPTVRATRFLIFCGLLGFVAAQLFFHLHRARDLRPVAEAEPIPRSETSKAPTAEQNPVPEPGPVEIDYPTEAIGGEFLIRFSTRAEYFKYLEALREADLQTLGRIEELLVIRISEEVFRRRSPAGFGGRPDFTLRVKRPLPPAELDPSALAALRPYAAYAREIVGGTPHGNGSGVTVAVLDSGFEALAPFDNVDTVYLDLTGEGVTGPGAAHGTSVASIIAGEQGISPNAELFVVRVLDESGLGNSFHVAEGIIEAVNFGADIINMSLGTFADSALLRDAVSYAAAHDVVLVAAAGNDGVVGMPFPAAYADVLSVTAVDSRGRQALFPNQSDKIDFAAPGVGIRTASAAPEGDLFTGTSAAAPFISGTLASLMSGEEALGRTEAIRVLKQHLNDHGAPGPDPEYGAGVIDWQRLRERSSSNILDIALADIYLEPDAIPGTSMPVEVTVQNRGTRWINEAELEVAVGDADPVSFSIGVLGPGQITTRKVHTQIPSRDSAAPLELSARVLPQDLNEDVRLNNNLKAVQFRLNPNL